MSGNKIIQKHKYLTLDAIRGVAAIFVLTRHAGKFFGDYQFPHSYLAVDLFFVMSGFVISVAYDESLLSKKLSVTDFLKVRAIRLYPLYLLALVLSVIFTLNNAILDTSPFNWTQFSAQLFFGLLLIPCPIPGTLLFPLNGLSWSIFFEVVANAAYAKFRFYLSNKTLMYVMVGCAPMLGVCVIANHSMDFGWIWRTAIGGFPRVLYSFAAGVLIYRVRKNLQFKQIFNNWMTLLVLLVVMLLLGWPFKGYTELFDLVDVLVLIPTLVLVATYIEPHKSSKLEKAYAALGLTSYAIYILQAPFVYAYSSVFMRHGYTSILPGIIGVFVFFSTSLLLDLYYDQPVRRWMRSKFLPVTK